MSIKNCVATSEACPAASHCVPHSLTPYHAVAQAARLLTDKETFRREFQTILDAG